MGAKNCLRPWQTEQVILGRYSFHCRSLRAGKIVLSADQVRPFLVSFPDIGLFVFFPNFLYLFVEVEVKLAIHY